MRIRADFTIGHPAAGVWAALSSPEATGWVPGLAVDAGVLTVDVETRDLVFDGTAAATSDARAGTVTVEAKGLERSGLGRARATVMLRVIEDGLFSSVGIEAEFALSGGLAELSRLIAEAFYRTADGFAEGLEAHLAGGRLPAAPGPVPVVPDAASAPTGEAREGWLRRALRRLRGR
jgi:carbon monoxide dehydrogenase subunit G